MVDLSKDELVEVSISNMEDLLISLLEIDFVSKKNPLKNSFSITLLSKKSPNLLFSNGKGSSLLSAKASALGEFIERLQTNNFFTDFYIKDFIYDKTQKIISSDEFILSDELQSFYNLNQELQNSDLIDFISDEENIITSEFINLRTEKKVDFPINILHNLYASNGLSAGNSRYESRVQALSEIIERYVKIEIITKGLSIPKIPDEVIQNIDSVSCGINILKKNGHIVDVYDASLGGKYPVIAISIINKDGVFISFGSHPIFEVALERTFTELLQGRELDELNNFNTPTFNIDEVDNSFNIENHFIDSNGKVLFDFFKDEKDFEYTKWNFSGGDRKEEFEELIKIFQDKEIYIKDFDYLGFYSCQIVIPTISEIYPIEDLIYNNKNRGKFYRNLILNYKNFDENDILEYLEELDDSLEVDSFIGVKFKEKCLISDLKAQTYIKLGDLESAKFYLNFNESKLNRLLMELIEMKQRGKDITKYISSLETIFGDNFKKAISIIENRENYINFEYNDEYKEVLRLANMLNKIKLRSN